jgi:SAM-dependent methyltransferase
MKYSESHLGKCGSDYNAMIHSGGLDHYMAIREAILVEALVNRMDPSQRGRYLDFACGSGRILSVIAPYFREVVAVDVSENMIQLARTAVPDATFHLRDLTTQDADIGHFDLISAFRFFGNAEDYLRRAVLEVLRKKVAPHGMLLLNNHRNPSSFLATLSRHKQGMDLHYPKLAKLLRDHGFEIVEQIPIGTWILRHRWCRRAVWDSTSGRIYDRLTVPSFLARFSPDMIILAKPF